MTTSGLVYLEKLGVAATSEYIEFEAGGMKGHATGADYSSDSGMLMLHSAVNMNGVTGGRPVTLTAATAEFDDRNQEASHDSREVRVAGADGGGGPGDAAPAARMGRCRGWRRRAM